MEIDITCYDCNDCIIDSFVDFLHVAHLQGESQVADTIREYIYDLKYSDSEEHSESKKITCEFSYDGQPMKISINFVGD